jgi:protein-L-isoaspartate(D-aspartate) O-methyltransferase
MRDYDAERRGMVEHQIRRRGIADPRVLAAMAEVPRERFVSSADADDAYGDHPLGIGCGQTISQPYMVGLMTESLRLRGEEKVLEIGAGSGYQAAILAKLCRQVYSVERMPALAERAQQTLAELGCDNVEVVVGDGSLGWPEAAPYDRIIVTAAAPKVADPWIEQLADGGRLVVPLGDRWGQMLTVVTKRGAKTKQESICGCVFVPLVGEHGWQSE